VAKMFPVCVRNDRLSDMHSGRGEGRGGGGAHVPSVPRVCRYLDFFSPRGAPFSQSEKPRRFLQKTGLSRKQSFFKRKPRCPPLFSRTLSRTTNFAARKCSSGNVVY
jgi:hypothetical protein